MAKRTIRDINISDKRLLVRVDFNVPLLEDGSIGNDQRIQAALPTLQYCLEKGASLVLMTHLGRPAGGHGDNLGHDDALGLRHVAYRLQQLLSGVPVELASSDLKRKADDLKPGEVLLLENLLFDPGEKTGDHQLAQRLRELGAIYVNDAFAACHCKQASMFALPKLFPTSSRVIGLLVEKELRMLNGLLESPQKPMVVILGGVKVADKIGVAEALLDRAQKMLIGGALAFTFMKARGLKTGASKVDEDQLDLARRLLNRASHQLVLPQDYMVSRQPDGAESQVVEESIPDGWCGLDIGPRTIQRYQAAIRGAGTVIWNGPLGKFEKESFRKGTEAVVRALAESDAVTVVGGGDSGQAVEQLNLIERIDHVSTGGEAFSKYLDKRMLPALSVIDDSDRSDTP